MDYGLLQRELSLKKKPIPFPIGTILQVQRQGMQYQNGFDRFVFYWLYLTGQRISEAISTERLDVTVNTIEGREFIVVSSITLKNRIQPRRNLPIPLFGDEKEMSEFVLKKVYDISDGKIFPRLTRKTAWNYLSKVSITTPSIDPESRKVSNMELPIYPHFLRHCRASHLAAFRGYDLFRLMQFFGWTTPTVASIYATLNWSSLAEGFIK